MVGRFLAGVGALIWDPGTGKYLLLRRAGDKDFGAGNWECVTGRVDQGESFEQALHREVQEEVGLRVRVEFLIGTTHFYRGAASPENELLGVVYGCTCVEREPVQLSVEHDAYRWVSAEEGLALLRPERLPEMWLRDILRRAEITRTRLHPSLRAFHRFNGFETD
ncbi:MAG: hypothetical protein Kow0077_14020 [Anaerolineae bacterium]